MLTVLRASERLIRKPQTIGVKVKRPSPISIGAMKAQKAICSSHFRCFQNGALRGAPLGVALIPPSFRRSRAGTCHEGGAPLGMAGPRTSDEAVLGNDLIELRLALRGRVG